MNNLVQIKRQPSQLPFTKLLNFCLLNARSIVNKTLQIKDYVVDKNIDILALTETWLKVTSNLHGAILVDFFLVKKINVREAQVCIL